VSYLLSPADLGFERPAYVPGFRRPHEHPGFDAFPKHIQGVQVRDYGRRATEGDRIIELNALEELYDIATTPPLVRCFC